MKQFLSINIAARTATELGGGVWTPPELTLGDDLTLALRFERTVDGQTVEAGETVNALWAAIGNIDAPPTAGKFAIKVGVGASTSGNTTTLLDYVASAGVVQAAINALAAPVGTYGTAKVWRADGSWFFRFGTGSVEVPLLVVDNSLTPISFGRFSASQLDGEWLHELRLQQAPGAFTDAAPRVLPPAPTVSRIRAGSTVDDFVVTEIQALRIAREFRGAYDLTFDGQRTDLLSQEDGPEEIQAALRKLNGGFNVTLPTSGVVNIEFAGDMAGATYDLLEVNVRQAPEGDLTLTLATDRAILWAMLRTVPSVVLPLHIRLNVTVDGAVKEVVVVRENITIARPLIWDDLATAVDTDWLLPPSPRDYIPYTSDQVLTGQQQAFPATIGDGAATSFSIAHNLASPVCSVLVVEVSSGRLLRDNEFTVVFTNENNLVVAGFGATPTAGQYQVLVIGVGPESVFQSHTHTMAQIVDLLDYLTDLSERVTDLESILPSTGPAGVPAVTGGLGIEILGVNTTLFLRPPQTGEFDPNALPLRPPFLLPAVHDSSVATLTDPLPTPVAASVWQNESGSTVLIPGGGQTGSSKVVDDGFVASDGRLLYGAVNDGVSTSYYPAAFERDIFTITINEKMLRLNGTFDVRFSLIAQILRGNCEGQWEVIIETGEIEADTTPSPIGLNLKKITWSDTPILRQIITISEVAVKHSFGARIKRSLVSLADTLTADKMSYGVWEGANDGAPDTANFALRARLGNFDVENVADPRGWLHYEVTGIDPENPTETTDKINASVTY